MRGWHIRRVHELDGISYVLKLRLFSFSKELLGGNMF